MKSLNNPVLTIALCVAAVFLLVTLVIPSAVKAHTDRANAARYAQIHADKDANLIKHCAAGHTGVVLYYKGVDCAANR